MIRRSSRVERRDARRRDVPPDDVTFAEARRDGSASIHGRGLGLQASRSGIGSRSIAGRIGARDREPC
jgi:hypothetical protein